MSNAIIITTECSDVLFSYGTPVAVFDKFSSKIYKTNKKWSVTTSKHIGKFIEKVACGDYSLVEEIHQNFLDEKYSNLHVENL